MSAYIGNAPGVGQDQLYVFFPADRATSLSGADSRGITLAYTVGEPFIEVQVNGRVLAPSDYTATDGSTITLASGSSFNTGDVVVVRRRSTYAPADTYTQAAADAAFASGTIATAFKNRVQNGCFRIAQRSIGAVPAVTPTYGLDRWMASSTNASTQSRFASTSYGSIWAYNLSMATAGAGSYVQFVQRIEAVDIADLVGKTVTLSFWAAAAVTTGGFSGSYYIGHPTSTIDTFTAVTYPISGAAFTLDGSNTRRTITFTVPANCDKGLEIAIRCTKDATAGTNLAMSLGSVQLEEGSKATPFERRPYQLELAMCQRFYHIGTAGFIGSAQAAGGLVGCFLAWPVRMHHAPTLVLGTASENVNNGAINFAPLADTVAGGRIYSAATAAGTAYYTNTYTASADL
jgi:hypothetical protein